MNLSLLLDMARDGFGDYGEVSGLFYRFRILRTEVLQAQSAQIDIVSGASFTSEGYAQSLQSALDKARGA